MRKTNIDIIIPSYQREEKAIILLNSLLKQKEKNFSLTLVLDSTTSSKFKLIQEEFSLTSKSKINDSFYGQLEIYLSPQLPLKVIIKPYRSGQGNCRNIGVKMSEAQYILFLDDDINVFDKMFLKKRVAFFSNKNSSQILTMGDFQFPPQQTIDFYTQNWDLAGLVRNFGEKLYFYQVFTSNLLGKRETFFYHPFNPLFREYGIEDLEFAYRLYLKNYSFFLDRTSTVFHYNKLTPQKLTTRFRSIGKNRIIMEALHPEIILIFDTISSYLFFNEKFLFYEHQFKEEEIKGGREFLQKLSFYYHLKAKDYSSIFIPPFSQGKNPVYLQTSLKINQLTYDWWRRIFLQTILLFLTSVNTFISQDKTTKISLFKEDRGKKTKTTKINRYLLPLPPLKKITDSRHRNLFLKGGREIFAKNYFFHHPFPL